MKAIHENRKTNIYELKRRLYKRKHLVSRKSVKGIPPGQLGENNQTLVSERLSLLGISHEQMDWWHPFDFLLEDGRRVDVKSSSPGYYTTSSPMYTFATKKGKKGDYCEFFILVTNDTKEIFVVPSKECKRMIRFCFPPPVMGFPSKWVQYHNRFDLLRRKDENDRQNYI